ncbi:MAG: hypothetical protein WBN22_01290 [Verrucomicrobiia bacterium]
MKQAFALWAAALISFWAAKPVIAAPVGSGIGDRLSLSITNKYGDVLANPTVAQILGDGLVLEQGTLEMKVKYENLPPSVRQKYQPLAVGVIKKEEKEDAANAAYVAYTQQLQGEQARHLAAQEQQENQQATDRNQGQAAAAPKYLAISIPNQNWKLIIADLGFSDWKKQEDNNQFVLHGQTGPGGFNLALFVEAPANNLPGNDPVYNFYWLNLAHDSLIDAQSVKVEREDKFIKVAYTAQGQPNVNYFFACQGKWVDVHLSKGSSDPGDDKLFAEFDNALSYGQ